MYELQRDVALQRRLLREVDDAHAATADLVIDPEIPEDRARR
jgi:hypothetical protein